MLLRYAIFAILALNFVVSEGHAARKPKKAQHPKPSWTYVEKQLRTNGFSENFIEEVTRTYETKHFEDVLRLNILLFLKKSDYHGTQVSSLAQKEVRQFISANRVALEQAEEKYDVPGTVISSLLWIESRHGKNRGDFHVPSVYLHLLQAPRESVQKFLLTQTSRYTKDPIDKATREKILLRTQTKADWALAELRALEKVYKWKWKMDRSFRGSFSGAFGMPQFLPSSYVKFARSVKPKAQPNLAKPADAILSVGHYLREHGWKTDVSRARVDALMKYNNSRDYANAILSLAEKLGSRRTASEKTQTEAPH